MMKSRKREMVDFKDKDAWFKEISFPIFSDKVPSRAPCIFLKT